MGKIAFLFAGQGAQAPGMGQQLWEQSEAARAVFARCDALRPATSEQCFSGTAEQLTQTANTQPCLFAVDLACAAAAVEAGLQPDGVAGFSLGELPAVAFAQLLSVEESFLLTCRRAALMQQCTEQSPGGMIAVLRLNTDVVETLCAQVGNCWPVNYNCPGQTVVACRAAALESLTAAVTAAGGRAMPLAVSGAFHSPLMDDAAVGLSQALAGLTLQAPRLPVYANLTAAPYTTHAAELLAAQVNHPVQWQKTIQQMETDGFDTFIEVGAGKTLSGLVRKILPEAAVYNISDSASLATTVAGVKA